jgi:hypothetical protein
MDEGLPEAWEALEPGTAVFASDGTELGTVKEVVGDQREDIFEGLIAHTHYGERFVSWEQIASIHERGVDLKLDASATAALPPPSTAPAAMEVGVDDVSEKSGAYKRDIWWKRFWNRISGNY